MYRRNRLVIFVFISSEEIKITFTQLSCDKNESLRSLLESTYIFDWKKQTNSSKTYGVNQKNRWCNQTADAHSSNERANKETDLQFMLLMPLPLIFLHRNKEWYSNVIKMAMLISWNTLLIPNWKWIFMRIGNVCVVCTFWSFMVVFFLL